jgi:hypothetical protein
MFSILNNKLKKEANKKKPFSILNNKLKKEANKNKKN